MVTKVRASPHLQGHDHRRKYMRLQSTRNKRCALLTGFAVMGLAACTAPSAAPLAIPTTRPAVTTTTQRGVTTTTRPATTTTTTKPATTTTTKPGSTTT